MIHPDTELRFIHPDIGFGVVATRLIPKGTITWAQDELDQVFTPQRVDSLGSLFAKVLGKYSFVNGRGEHELCWDLARYVNQQVGARLIEGMRLPLGIVATDLLSGQSMLFQRGDTGTAVRASSAVPAVFQPVRIAGHDYVDGGLVQPVPVRAARQMGAELVIAVDISSPPDANLGTGTLDVLLQTVAIMSKSINYFELRDAEVVVRPALSGISSADFGARKRSIEAGRQAMLQALPQLRAAIAARMH